MSAPVRVTTIVSPTLHGTNPLPKHPIVVEQPPLSRAPSPTSNPDPPLLATSQGGSTHQ